MGGGRWHYDCYAEATKITSSVDGSIRYEGVVDCYERNKVGDCLLFSLGKRKRLSS